MRHGVDGDVSSPETVFASRLTSTGADVANETRKRWADAKAEHPPVVRSAVNTWAVEPHGDATMVTLTTKVDAGPRPPQQLLARALGKVMAKASREMLGGLKTQVERVDAAAVRS